MEFDEQKPKDTLLDRKIKQETYDFIENVKEEPIGEDEYSKQILPKQETEESLENLKREPIENYSSKQLIPKLEEIIEAETSISEEPTQLIQKNVRSQYHLCSVCLQRYAYCLLTCARKEEGKLVNMVACVLRGSYTLEQARSIMSKNSMIYICHYHFSESLNEIYKILKIENPEEIASCSVELKENLMITVNSICPHIMTSQFCAIVYGIALKNSKRKQTNFKTVGGPDKMDGDRFCAVCSLSRNVQYTKNVIMEEEKLVIMMGCVLRGDWNLDQAKLFIAHRSQVQVCHIHFSNAVQEIHKFLGIKNPEEIASCSKELMQKLMVTVNSICPHIMTSQFYEILYSFVRRNNSQLGMISKTEEGSFKKSQLYRCPVCSQFKNGQCTKNVTLEDEKLVIMIGSVLRGDWNLDQAALFMNRRCLHICHAHLSDAFHEIFKFLDIKKTTEFASCSDELMQNLMNTVNSICPRVDSTQFRIVLYGFGQRNITQKRKRPNTEVDQNPKKRQQNFRCTMCSQIQNRTCLKQVTLKCEKLIIMIGYILGGDYTIEEVKQFLYKKKPYLMICHAHLVEANNEILNVLQINNPGGIISCSSELMEKLMVTVNAIDPEITIPSFQKDLRNFAMRIKQHLGKND